MPKHVTPELFVSTWKKAWKEWYLKSGGDWDRDYDSLPERTNHMLGKGEQGGFLNKVVNILKKDEQLDIYTCLREFMYLDFVCVGKKNALSGRDSSHALYLPLILEHENTGDTREEMWKLCIYRSPLKVLVTYDWDEDQKEAKEKRKNWLEDTLEALSDIRDRFDGAYRENSATRYLFIVGNRKIGGDTQWHYFCDWIELKG